MELGAFGYTLFTTARVNIDFLNIKDSNLLEMGLAVHEGMNGVLVFANPPTPMPLFLDNLNIFQAAIGTASSRDLDAIILRNLKKRIVIVNMFGLAIFVTATAAGDLDVLSGSRFNIRKPNTTSPPLETPYNVRAIDGTNPGEITVACDSTKYAKAYVFNYMAMPVTDPNAWISVNSTSCSCTLKGLTKGTTYLFRICAIDAREQITYSDTTTRVAQ